MHVCTYLLRDPFSLLLLLVFCLPRRKSFCSFRPELLSSLWKTQRNTDERVDSSLNLSERRLWLSVSTIEKQRRENQHSCCTEEEKNMKTITEAIRRTAVYICHSYLVARQKRPCSFLNGSRVYNEKNREIFPSVCVCMYVYVCIKICKYGTQYRTCYGEFKISYGTNPLTPNKMFPITAIDRLLCSKRYTRRRAYYRPWRFVQRIARIIIPESKRENRRSILRFLQRQSAKQKSKKKFRLEEKFSNSYSKLNFYFEINIFNDNISINLEKYHRKIFHLMLKCVVIVEHGIFSFSLMTQYARYLHVIELIVPQFNVYSRNEINTYGTLITIHQN